MKIINEITISIIRNVGDGDTIHNLSKRIGFAYSAVYKWINILEDYNVIHIIKKGNKNVIKINDKNIIYNKFIELGNAIDIIDKDRIFWKFIKKIKLHIRFVKGTAVVIWTQGGYITGDFSDRIYFLEVYKNDKHKLEDLLRKYNIAFSSEKIIEERPFIFIIIKKSFKIVKMNNLPVMPLSELVLWCKKLHLENILEHLDLLYNLKLNAKYSEIRTNV